jgi:TatD DNase family protein
MELFDTHCHLDAPEFDADREAVLQATRAAGVTHLLVPATEQATWHKTLSLCAANEGLYPALGMHPVYIDRHQDRDIGLLEAAIADSAPTAIGEIGLDFQLRDLDRERQLRLFEHQLAVAAAAGLPVVLHVRKAHEEVLKALSRHALPGGFCHAFNGSLQQAERYRDMGFCVGFGGMLTFERSRRLRGLASALPLDAIVLETDAPDLTVASHRYQRNSPAYLPEVLETLASLRDEAVEEIASRTVRNGLRVLRLGD